MTLDPDAAAVLAEMKERQRGMRISEVPVEQLRAGSRANMATGPDVDSVDDREIPGPAGPLAVRVYRPEAGGQLPALVFLHGGGWILCDLDTHDGLCRRLTMLGGVAVISVDYRRAPEHRFPAAFDDGYAAARWVIANATELGVDPQRVAIGGDSAGASIAAAIALAARDDADVPLAFQLLLYPAADYDLNHPSAEEFTAADGWGATEDAGSGAGEVRWFWDQYLRDEADAVDARAVPAAAPSVAGAPAAYVMTAEHDVLRDGGEAYAHRFEAAGVPTQLVRWAGVYHPFLQALGRISRAEDAVADAARAVGAALAGDAVA